jgi:YD repeat-containing protein
MGWLFFPFLGVPIYAEYSGKNASFAGILVATLQFRTRIVKRIRRRRTPSGRGELVDQSLRLEAFFISPSNKTIARHLLARYFCAALLLMQAAIQQKRNKEQYVRFTIQFKHFCRSLFLSIIAFVFSYGHAFAAMQSGPPNKSNYPPMGGRVGVNVCQMVSVGQFVSNDDYYWGVDKNGVGGTNSGFYVLEYAVLPYDTQPPDSSPAWTRLASCPDLATEPNKIPIAFSHGISWCPDPASDGRMPNFTTHMCDCPDGSRYFVDAKQCVAFGPLTNPAMGPIGNPATNGNVCCHVGDPISPSSGNNWRTDTDYAAGVASGLVLARTYNSNPFSNDAYVSRSFGTRWTQPFDRNLVRVPNPQAVDGKVTCYTRNDTQQMFCENPPSNAALDGVSITRGDGKSYLFQKSGSIWIAKADIDERVSPIYAADATTITGWIYKTAADDVEQYDAGGKLLSVTNRSGAVQTMTYSNGITNDTSAGRMPANAPACTNVQSGAVLPAGLLLCVTDNWGLQLQFEYDSQQLMGAFKQTARIVKAIDPAGRNYLYAYDGPSGGCTMPGDKTNPACSANNLTQVIYPDGKVRTYLYNETAQINGGTTCTNTVPVTSGFGNLLNSLTGMVDENGVRYASWTYDCQGRATSNQLAGGVAKVTLAYGTPDATTGNRSTTAVDYIGDPANPQTRTRTYSFQMQLGAGKNTGIDQPCAECGLIAARTYDANSNVASRTDFNGTVTTYAYDMSRNLEISRTEAAGTTQARTITTQWHASYRLPAKIAEPLRITTLTYDTSGNLLSKTIQATNDATGAQGMSAAAVGTARTWNYTYNSVGQVMTATGPRTDVVDKTTYTYDTSGNLVTITNPLDHVTILSNYDANGRVGKIVDANGMTTDLAYSSRGWLMSRVVSGAGGGAETTNYDYDGMGQLTKVTQPDGSNINYTYDDAHRLTAIADSLGNSILYTLDAMGNRTNEQVKDPNGALARQTSRVYDALNRLQQVTGGVQ